MPPVHGTPLGLQLGRLPEVEGALCPGARVAAFEALRRQGGDGQARPSRSAGAAARRDAAVPAAACPRTSPWPGSSAEGQCQEGLRTACRMQLVWPVSPAGETECRTLPVQTWVGSTSSTVRTTVHLCCVTTGGGGWQAGGVARLWAGDLSVHAGQTCPVPDAMAPVPARPVSRAPRRVPCVPTGRTLPVQTWVGSTHSVISVSSTSLD